jgi:DNA-binding winged helix-turn-helix (wHTH) protein/tetratricopeptide (TPR) repeat protein
MVDCQGEMGGATMRYVFGDYSLDTQRYELSRAGVLIPLRPKVFQVLAYLLAQRDRVVLKEELLDHLWPAQYVGDAALNSYIMAVRQALGDSGQRQGVIRTVRGRGYRFVAPVAEQDSGHQAEPLDRGGLAAEEAPGRVPIHRSPPLAADTSWADTPLADGEYKFVTILCCALAGPPALVSHRGLEFLYRRMQVVFELFQEILQEYEGTLIHQASDGFTAVFGAPVAQEDHARRAVLAALTLRLRLGDLPPLYDQTSVGVAAVWMGLHSGWVVGGSLGHDAQRLYTVVGDPTDLVMRLRHPAVPGTILLSAPTYHLVHEEVEVEACGTLAMGEGLAPMPLYAVRGIIGRSADVHEHLPQAQSPFVGREWELALLHERLAAAVAGQGQVVSLVGEPGMGKTRLLNEFRRRLPAGQVLYYAGQCLSYGQAIPYHPLRDILRQVWAVGAEGDAQASAIAVRRRLQDMGVVAAADAALVLQVLNLPVAPESLTSLHPQARKSRAFALLRQVILHEAQRQPLVLAVENLHWSDATSEEWLASLVERLTGAALLLLVTYRPGYQPPWAAHSAATQLALPPLGPQDGWVVAQTILRRAPPPQASIQEIVAKAGGNPFFLEELAWHAIEPGRPQTPVAVPETVHAVLSARIDRLPVEAKHLVQTAAVLGNSVPVPLLLTIADMPEEALQRALAHLQAVGWLYETREVPELTYTFRHVLTHEVAYGSLLQERRRILHARLVEALETLNADRLGEQVERLADHAFRGELWNKALDYYWQAGTKAFSHSAHREAVACFEQALKALEHLPEDCDRLEQAIALRVDLRHALVRLGVWQAQQRVLDVLGDAERLARALGARRQLAQISGYIANHLQWIGNYGRALTAGQQALALAVALGDEALRGLANAELGPIYYYLGDYSQAQEVLRQSVAALADERSQARLGHATLLSVHPHAWLLMCLAQVGAFAEGRAVGAAAVRIAEAGESPYGLAMAYQGAGLLSLGQGDFADAIAVLERGLDLCRSSNLENWFYGLAASLGYTYALSGRLDEALPLLEEVVERDAAMRGGHPLSIRVIWQSEACLLAGRVKEAQRLALQAFDLVRTRKERGHEAWALRLLGEIGMQRDPPNAKRAETYCRQGLTLAQALGMRPLQAHCHRALGRLYAKTGQPELARMALSTAMAQYRGMAMPFWLSTIEATQAQAARP